MNGIIVGIDKTQQGNMYRVISYKGLPEEKQYSKAELREDVLINALLANKITLDNAEVVNNKIKGKGASLQRFTNGNTRPVVIISEIVADDKIIGYRMATYDGSIRAVRLKEMLAYCARVNTSVPIQNAMYVPESASGKAHIRAYPEQKFHRENLDMQKSKVARPAKPDIKTNAKQVSRLEELFSKGQIKQLKLGRDSGIDIRIYGNNKLSPEQMQELRTALEGGINPKAFADPAYSAPVMKALRIQAKYGVDITYFVNPKFNVEQIYELSTGYLSGVDISKYADPEMSAEDMAKKRIYLESQIWDEVKAQQGN